MAKPKHMMKVDEDVWVALKRMSSTHGISMNNIMRGFIYDMDGIGKPVMTGFAIVGKPIMDGLLTNKKGKTR